MGATDFGYKIARQFGLKIVQTSPALVPFTFSEEILHETRSLAGVSTNAITTIGKRHFEEALLFTHKGLSGPAILQISSYWNHRDPVKINLAPKIDVYEWLKTQKETAPKQEISGIITQILPKSLALYILNQNKVSGRLAEINNKNLEKIAQNINNWQCLPHGTEGYAKAEVTLGGVDTDEISSKTFESKKVKNLYFIGEVLDVTGHLGGYNFQWAWSSGFSAGQNI
jgi:predicted Rossmann fold flavoprotein